MKYFALSASFLFLAACATLSEDQCRSGDWYSIGRNDGANGRQANFITQHAKACRDYSIRPVVSEWERGRQDGLRQYCVPSNAYEVGPRGRHLSPVCPAADLPRLERANARGLTYHRITQDMREVQNDISSLNSQIAALPPGDPSRGALISERSTLRLELLTLRTQRAQFRYY